MNFVPPAPATITEPAAWLMSRIDWDSGWVTGTVGTGHEAYARVFHPLDREPDSPRWADVAEQHGRVMHPSAGWDYISSTAEQTGPESFGRTFPGDPEVGNLDSGALVSLCAVLGRFTLTPDNCWFGVWDGWGWQHPGAQAIAHAATQTGEPAPPLTTAPDAWHLDLAAPKFSLPGREYHLYNGPIDAATRIGHWVTADWFDPQSPSLFWPTDHAWCVATEIDFDSTFVGGTADLVAAICNSPHLEAWPIAPDAPARDLVNL